MKKGMRIGNKQTSTVAYKDYASAPTFSATYHTAKKHTSTGTQLFPLSNSNVGDKL